MNESTNQDIQGDFNDVTVEAFKEFKGQIQDLKDQLDDQKDVIIQLVDAIDKLNPRVRQDIFAGHLA